MCLYKTFYVKKMCSNMQWFRVYAGFRFKPQLQSQKNEQLEKKFLTYVLFTSRGIIYFPTLLCDK